MQDRMTFGASLAAFMAGRGLSVAALTRLTGMKSATTVSRLVHDQSAPKRCAAFLDTLQTSFPDMTAEELALLEGGLQLSHTDEEKAGTARAMERLFLGCADEPAASPLSELLLAHTDADQYDIYCMQCIDAPILDAFALLLRHGHRKTHIHHFLVEPMAMTAAAFFAATRQYLCDPRYTLICRHIEASKSAWVPGNMFLLRTVRHQTEQQFLLILKPHGRYEMLPLDAATDLYSFLMKASMEASVGLPPVTDTSGLNTPRSGLAYLEKAYQREKGRTCSLLRTRPDLSMVPIDLLQEQYNDAPALQLTSVKDYYMEMRRLCYLRHANRMENPRNTRIIFSMEGLSAFLRDGLLMDHFHSLRPYTPEERRLILQHLLSAAESSPGLQLHIARDEQLFRDLHISGYDSGVLLSPIVKQFIGMGGGKPYTEAYITNSTFVRQFHDYFHQVIIPQYAYPEEASRAMLRSLLAEE